MGVQTLIFLYTEIIIKHSADRGTGRGIMKCILFLIIYVDSRRAIEMFIIVDITMNGLFLSCQYQNE
jgi:hypothetical protein